MKEKDKIKIRKALERDIKALDWDFSHARHFGIQRVAHNALVLKRAKLRALGE